MPIPMFKEPKIMAKVRRGLQRAARKGRLDAKKTDVRVRDKRCRVPSCGCGRFNLALHVSHSTHEGMGGNAAEDRSDPSTMVLVCAARHKEHAVSIDKRTLKWEPVDLSRGANGPIAWWVDLRALHREHGPVEWFLLAVETSGGQWEPFSDEQADALRILKAMDR